MHLRFIMRDVKSGKGNKYFGLVIVKKASTASISIGDYCTFRSSRKSNFIGINHPCYIVALEPNATISIGNNVGLSGAVISCFNSIKIGNNVKIGANTVITDGDWHKEDPRSGVIRPIVIENNVWIGLNSVILKGVHVGENSVIGAGSVVTKNIPPNVVAAGNPCVVIKNI